MATSGKYDHPSYLTRQQVGMKNLAGASGTTGYKSFISAMRVRTVVATVQVAGTSATSGNTLALYSGTTGLATFTIGTNTKASVLTSADLNATIPAGTVLSLVTGTDATAVNELTLEMYLDPAATWTGTNN